MTSSHLNIRTPGSDIIPIKNTEAKTSKSSSRTVGKQVSVTSSKSKQKPKALIRTKIPQPRIPEGLKVPKRKSNVEEGTNLHHINEVGEAKDYSDDPTISELLWGTQLISETARLSSNNTLVATVKNIRPEPGRILPYNTIETKSNFKALLNIYEANQSVLSQVLIGDMAETLKPDRKAHYMQILREQEKYFCSMTEPDPHANTQSNPDPDWIHRETMRKTGVSAYCRADLRHLVIAPS